MDGLIGMVKRTLNLSTAICTIFLLFFLAVYTFDYSSKFVNLPTTTNISQKNGFDKSENNTNSYNYETKLAIIRLPDGTMAKLEVPKESTETEAIELAAKIYNTNKNKNTDGNSIKYKNNNNVPELKPIYYDPFSDIPPRRQLFERYISEVMPKLYFAGFGYFLIICANYIFFKKLVLWHKNDYAPC